MPPTQLWTQGLNMLSHLSDYELNNKHFSLKTISILPCLIYYLQFVLPKDSNRTVIHTQSELQKCCCKFVADLINYLDRFYFSLKALDNLKLYMVKSESICCFYLFNSKSTSIYINWIIRNIL